MWHCERRIEMCGLGILKEWCCAVSERSLTCGNPESGMASGQLAKVGHT